MYSRRDLLTGAGACALLGLSGCSGPLLGSGPNESPPSAVGNDWSPPAGTWATAGRDPHNTRAVDSTGPGADAAPTAVARFGDAGTGVATVLAATPTVAYLLDAGGAVRAVGTDDWDEQWRRSLSGTTGAPGGVVDGSLYLAGEGRIRALASGGDERWLVDHHGALEGTVGDEWLEDSPSLFGPHVVPTPDRLYAVSSYGFHGLAPEDGTETWRVVFPDAPRSRPDGAAVTANAVWTTSGDTLFRLAGGSGVETTAARLPVGTVRPPAVASSRGLVTPRGGSGHAPYTLAAYGTGLLGDATEPPSPSPDWRARLHPDVDAEVYGVTRPAVAGGRAVVAEAVATTDEQRATVAGVDVASGDVSWRVTLPAANPNAGAATGRLFSDPVVADGTALVGVGPRVAQGGDPPASESGAVVALDAETGEERWRYEPEIVPRRLVVAGDYCYVADGAGAVAVLG